MKPYTFGYSDMDNMENFLMLQAIQTAVVLLLVVVGVNVATLVYARTASRRARSPFVRRSARPRRMVAQLFTEALVLSALAAIGGSA